MNHDDISFKLTIPIEKSESGEDGWYIKGVATGAMPDPKGDYVSHAALQKLVEQINSSQIPFMDWHNEETIASEVGYLTKGWVEGDYLWVEVRLDEDNPNAQYLWKKLDKGKKYGMSIRGNTHRPRYDVDKNTGRQIRVHDDVTLKEVSGTTRPIFSPSLGTVLKKAADSVELSLPEGDTSDMETPVTDVAETVETLAPESSAPENDTVAENVEEVEKAVTTESRRDARKLAKLVKLHAEMAELIKDLGLDGDTSDNADSSETVEPVAKAEETSDEAPSADVESLVKSAVEETTAAFRAEIEALRAQIPSVPVPGVLVKSEDTNDREIIESLRTDPRTALRAGLAAKHGELDRLQR